MSSESRGLGAHELPTPPDIQTCSPCPGAHHLVPIPFLQLFWETPTPPILLGCVRGGVFSASGLSLCNLPDAWCRHSNPPAYPPQTFANLQEVPKETQSGRGLIKSTTPNPWPREKYPEPALEPALFLPRLHIRLKTAVAVEKEGAEEQRGGLTRGLQALDRRSSLPKPQSAPGILLFLAFRCRVQRPRAQDISGTWRNPTAPTLKSSSGPEPTHTFGLLL